MNRILLLLFLVLNTPFFGKAQARFKAIPAEYPLSNETPLQLHRGDTLIVTCDTVYLINKIRYEFYKSIHTATLHNDNEECNQLLRAYEKRVKEHELSYSKLLANCTSTEKSALDMVAYTRKSLEETQHTLQFTQQALEQSSTNLDRANELLRKEKWNVRGQKLLVGVAGVGLGILVGVLMVH